MFCKTLGLFYSLIIPTLPPNDPIVLASTAHYNLKVLHKSISRFLLRFLFHFHLVKVVFDSQLCFTL